MTHRVARVAVTNARLPPLDCLLQWRELRRYVSTVVLLQLLNIMNIENLFVNHFKYIPSLWDILFSRNFKMNKCLKKASMEMFRRCERVDNKLALLATCSAKMLAK